jgi:hypothetical protein
MLKKWKGDEEHFLKIYRKKHTRIRNIVCIVDSLVKDVELDPAPVASTQSASRAL